MGNSTRLCNLERALRFFVLSIGISLSLINTTQAKDDQLCDLVGSIKKIGDDEVIRCIDFAKHDGDTLDVSSEVSSISTAGLSLCPLIDIEVTNCDIMYVLDQSQSMPTKAIAIYTASDDTIYSHNGIGAFNDPKDGDMDIIWGDGTKKVPFIINSLLKKNNKQARWAGDPFGQSAIALHKTLDYQHTISPRSFAGFTGLHKEAAHKVKPAILNSSTLKNLKDSIFINDYVGRTDFYPSLKVAKNWLLDKSNCKNEKQMIIFISDGAPTDSNLVDQNNVKCKKYLQLLDEFHPGATGIMPPIIGIFLGKEGAVNYKPLQDLADTTNGEFYIVPPDQPDSLVGVLKSIIESTFEAPPLDISLTNESIVPNQTSYVDKSKLIQQVDGSWLMELDSSIALIPGYNDIRVEIEKTDADGNKEKQIHRVTLNSTDNTADLDTLFEENCYDLASLELFNSSNSKTDTLTDEDTLCDLYMLHYDKHSLHTYELSLRSLVTNDSETITFRTDDTVHTSIKDRKRMKQSFTFHSNDTIAPTKHNDTLETVAIDTIIAEWKNLRNIKDTLTDTFYVRGEEIIFEPEQATIYDRDENGRADSIAITFNRSLPRLFPIEKAYWNKESSEAEKGNATESSIDDDKQIHSFRDDQFPLGFTGISETLSSHELPKVMFKEEKKYKFPTSEIRLKDRVGPIPTKAVLKRSHPLHGSYDTLQVTVSEKLTKVDDKRDYKKFIRIVNPADVSTDEFVMYDKSKRIELHTASSISKSSDSLTYQFIIAKSHLIERGSRLFLDKESEIKDRAGNRASRLSVPLDDMGVLYFTLKGSSTPIDSLFPKVTPIMVANFYSLSLTDERDSIAMEITTETGDKERFFLLETDKTSGIYRKEIPTDYIAEAIKNNGTVEAEFVDPFTNAFCNSKAVLAWQGEEISDKLVLCYKGIPYIEDPKLYVKNRNNVVSVTIEDVDTQISVLLDIYNKIALESFEITLKTAKHGDSELITLTKADSLVGLEDTLRIIMAKKIAHSCSDIIAPKAGNNILETSANDTLFLSWINPITSAESAFDTVIVKGKEESIGVSLCTIKDLNEDGAGDIIDVVFDTILPMDFAVDSAFWNENSADFRRVPHSFTNLDDRTIRYSFESNPFPVNLTAAQASNAPKLYFSEDQEYPLEKKAITIGDGIGPVPVQATLFASHPTTTNPDTLQITLSEPCKASATAAAILLRKSVATGMIAQIYEQSTVLDGVESVTLSPDGVTLTALVSQRGPQEYSSLSLCVDTTTLADSYGNRVSRKAIPITYKGKLFFTEHTTPLAKVSFNTNSSQMIDAHLYSLSSSAGIDMIQLALTTIDGDIEQATLVESSATSGYYYATLPIAYVPSVLQNNSTIEGAYLSPYSNDTTTCHGALTHAGEEQKTSFTLTYIGADDFYVTDKSNIRTQALTHRDVLFAVNLNCEAATVSPSYTVVIQSNENSDVETMLLNPSVDNSNAAIDPLRILLSKSITFISSDIVRPTVENGRVEASALDTLFISCTDIQKGKTHYDTIVITGEPIRFAPVETVILDTNENGIADKLYTTYNHPIPEPFLYKALYWNSSSATPIQTLSTVATVGATDTLTWPEQTTIATGISATTPQEEMPKLLLGAHDFLKFDALQSIVTDGMGAVALEAKLLCSHHGSLAPDTLVVTASEPIQQPVGSVLSPVRSCQLSEVLNPLSPISGYESSQPVVTTTPFLIDTENAVVLFPTKDDPALLKGSQLFLNRESSGTDLAGNPHSRKRVALKRYEKLYFSLPENPDSIITFAEWPNHGEVLATLPVESTDDLLVETVLLHLTLPTGDSETITMVETSAISGIFTALLPIQFCASPVPNSGTIEAVYLNPDMNGSDTLIAESTTADGVTSVSTLPLLYNAPPRIKRALYFPSALDLQTPDTLRLLTNVPILWPATPNLTIEEMYDYWDGLQSGSNGTVASLLQEHTVGLDSLATILIPRESALTPQLDSIRFVAGSPLITTEKGIHPVAAAYTVIEYGALPPIEVAAVPNPFIPGTSLLPEIFGYYVPSAPETGVGFRVRSRLKFSEARYTVFDAVNNMIIADIPLTVNESLSTLYGTWDGKNSSNRTVGDGAYMVIFTIIDIYGQAHEKQILVGVKESYIPKYTFPWHD